MEICLLARGPRRLPRQARQGRAPSIRCCSTASSRTRSRSTSTRSATASDVLARRRHAARRGGGRPLRRLRLRAAADEPRRRDARADRGDDPPDRARARRDRADQHPVRGRRRRALRDRGQPAGLAHGPVRLQGDRRAAGEDRLPADARRAPRRPAAAGDADAATSRVKEAVLPFVRFAGADTVLGPGDEEHRRGDGRRRGLPDGLRQGAGGRRRRRCPTSGTVFITVTDVDKPAATRPRRRCCTTSASRSSRPRGTAQAISRMGIPVETINKIAGRLPARRRLRSSAARSTS